MVAEIRWGEVLRGTHAQHGNAFTVRIGAREAAIGVVRGGVSLLDVGEAGDDDGHFAMRVLWWPHGGVLVAQPGANQPLSYAGASVARLAERMARETWEPGVRVGADWRERRERFPFGSEARLRALRDTCGIGEPSYDSDGLTAVVFGPLDLGSLSAADRYRVTVT